MSASDLATAAAEYHAHGWPMVPVNADKEATASFKQWKQRLQTAQEARAFPWTRLHGLALLTWPYSDLVVLDFDGPHAEQVWREHTGLALPETATTRTGGGWTHRIYRVPPGTPRPGTADGAKPQRKIRLEMEAVPCGGLRDKRMGRVKACGVDLLLNGYFVVPPTPGYREDPDHPFEPGNITVIPQGILDLARRKARAVPHTTEPTDGDWFAAAMRGPVLGGGRNETVNKLAFELFKQGLPHHRVTPILELWAATACDPPLVGDGEEMKKLRGTIQSAEAAGKREAAKRHGPGPPEGRFTKGLSELLKAPDEPVAYLVERLLVAASNGFIGGEPKSLKSWLALYLALCLAVCVPVFGRYSVPTPVRVLYLQEEDGERRVRRRIRRLLKAMGTELPGDPLFRYSIKAGLLLDDEKWMGALREELAVYRPAIVIADVFELMHSKDSDRRAELKPVLYQLDRLREEFGCGFLLVDHFKKASIGTSRRGGQRLAGTVGKHAWGECSLYLFPGQGKNQVRVETELKDGPSEAFGLTLEDSPEGGVSFRWEPEATDRAGEMKAKILEAVEGLASPEGWVTVKQVAEGSGVSGSTASRWLTILADEDGKLERQRFQVGKTKAWHYRMKSVIV